MARRKAKSRRKKSKPLPGWLWMMFGLAIGLAIAFAVFRQRPALVIDRPVPQAASIVEDERDEPMVSNRPDPEPRKAEYDFYDLLPEYEIVIPDDELDVRPEAQADPANQGVYEIQAGAFSRVEDADRRRAELALLGLESRIQRVSIDDATIHRVRIGPISDLDELKRRREQLRRAGIDYRAVRIGG